MSAEALPRMVVCAAFRLFVGDRQFLIIGIRHLDSFIRKEIETSPWLWSTAEQGFVDQKGVFMTREEAWEVAVAANQIRRRVGGDGKKLFSENLY